METHLNGRSSSQIKTDALRGMSNAFAAETVRKQAVKETKELAQKTAAEQARETGQTTQAVAFLRERGFNVTKI